MTVAMSEALAEYFASLSFLRLTTTTSVIAIALLIIVAVEREIIRATSPEGQRRNVTAFVVVVIPMTFTVAAVIIARFMHLS